MVIHMNLSDIDKYRIGTARQLSKSISKTAGYMGCIHSVNVSVPDTTAHL